MESACGAGYGDPRLRVDVGAAIPSVEAPGAVGVSNGEARWWLFQETLRSQNKTDVRSSEE
ncbi:hypothetical protein Ct61P_00756 [Colletotrichum tofieldiae]|nr:hypothetical protein Ct61P_00756 [Colletotrichum tofieldiae]